MAMPNSNHLREMATELDRFHQWIRAIVCKLQPAEQAIYDRAILAGIYARLSEIAKASTFGQNAFEIRPYTANATPQKIVERDTMGRVRKITIWTDAASGGPTPTIRISTSGAGTASGGVRINAGQANTIGEIPPNTELWIASTASMPVYVVEVA